MKKILLLMCSALLIGFCSCGSDDSEELPIDNPSISGLKSGQIELKGYPDKTNKKILFSIKAKKITINWGDGIIEEFTRNGTAMDFTHEYTNSNYQTILIDTEDITEFFSYYDSGDGYLYEFRANDCPQLENITIYGNNYGFLSVLETVKCRNLEILNCASNKLTELDVTEYPKLKTLRCDRNDLSHLEVTQCPNLEILSCGGNNLFALRIAESPNLKIVNCSQNDLASDELNNMFNKLPNTNGKICIEGNIGSETCNDKIMKDKGWKYNCDYPRY